MSTELIVALDVPTLDQANTLLDQLAGSVRWFKVGLQLFTAHGPSIIREIRAREGRVFLDLKFHDIPNTVAGAAQSAVGLGVEMFNVHASGGAEMMRAACDGAARSGGVRPMIIAVTVLTSQTASEQDVVKLASSAKTAGLDGVVCSAREAVTLKRELGAGFKLICPGIRPAWSEVGDQKRIVTPADAVRAGADYIVVGRPILADKDPAEAAKRVLGEMEKV